MILKIALIIYVTLYIGVALFLRSYILYRRTGVNVFKTMGRSGIQGFNERVLMLSAMNIPVITLFYLFPRKIYQFLVPIDYLEIPLVQYVGVAIMLIGCLVGIIAQFQMGDAWRIGINKNENTLLVTEGFYKFSRNPIYLFLLLSFIGFFLVVPNCFSLCCVAVSYPALEIKIRLEEEYLLNLHGEAFETYMKKVRRWF